MKTTRKVKAKALATGTEVVYLGGSRSEKLRAGQAVTIAGSAPNANGSVRYNVRFQNAKGQRFSTWLAGRYVRAVALSVEGPKNSDWVRRSKRPRSS